MVEDEIMNQEFLRLQGIISHIDINALLPEKQIQQTTRF